MRKVLILSGVHGNEYSAVKAGMLLNKIYENAINIDVYPFVNINGLIHNTRDVPDMNSADLNRQLINDSYDPVIFLKSKIEEYDVVIDIHNSPRCSNFVLIDKVDNQSIIKRFCIESNVKYTTRYNNANTIKKYVNSIKNKIGITYEFNGMSDFNNDTNVKKACDDIMSLLYHINDSFADDDNIDDHMLKDLYCTKRGYIDYAYDINSYIMPDQVAFNVLDESGNILESVKNNTKNKWYIISQNNNFSDCGGLCMQYYEEEVNIYEK